MPSPTLPRSARQAIHYADSSTGLLLMPAAQVPESVPAATTTPAAPAGAKKPTSKAG